MMKKINKCPMCGIHQNIKVKAELFDEIADIFGFASSCSATEWAAVAFLKSVDEILSKAKELDK